MAHTVRVGRTRAKSQDGGPAREVGSRQRAERRSGGRRGDGGRFGCAAAAVVMKVGLCTQNRGGGRRQREGLTGRRGGQARGQTQARRRREAQGVGRNGRECGVAVERGAGEGSGSTTYDAAQWLSKEQGRTGKQKSRWFSSWSMWRACTRPGCER